MLKTIRKILGLLSRHERRNAYLLLVMVLVMAMLDMAGVASVMPFMSVLANPGAIQENALLHHAYEWIGFESTNDFLYFLGVTVFILLLISIAFKALTTYVLLRYTYMRAYTLGRRLVAAYLHQPYDWFLNHHSADLGKTILAEVQQVVNGALIPLMQMIAHATVAVSLTLLLIVADPILATMTATGLGLGYAVIYFSLRGYLGRRGVERVKVNKERFQVVQEAFGGIKDVKVSGLEAVMLERFNTPAKRYATMEAGSQIVAQLPRFAMEAIAFGGMLLVVLYLMRQEGGLATALPMIALYAFAGYRLMPALQQVYIQLSKMRFASAALDALYDDIHGMSVDEVDVEGTEEKRCLSLKTGLCLEGVSYTYPHAEKKALSSINLFIPAKKTIAFVGSTGSGKTTIVDVILGLLRPQEGRLLVDDMVIDESNMRQWQSSIGYVPQHIYLSDDSVAANIAFGVPREEVDLRAVEVAAKVANLHDFIVSELTHGYQTIVGERGVRLSGGQRQRIGIARALYHDPAILILDEATSALDNLTEKAIMDSVNNLGHDKTIIMIAHRLSTVRNCDEIFMLEKGCLLANGSYEMLISANETFRTMAARNA